MNLAEYQKRFIAQIEKGLKAFFYAQDFGESQKLQEMLAYHMGWRDGNGHGKRLRPLITLLCTSALGGEVSRAMPAALAIEFLHNFTLIHDDIEDYSPLRHGRETLWKRWGQAQAINAGDALFSIAQLAIMDLANSTNHQVAVQAARRFNQTCLNLTRGQYLDIAFERNDTVTITSYLDMIRGKTAALIAFSAAVAGMITEAEPADIDRLDQYGENLGLAFQIQDDALGIWGDPAITGKSAASDLLAKKKTLPVIYGLENCEAFRESWLEGEIRPDRVREISGELIACGAQEYVREIAKSKINAAFKALEALFDSKTNMNEPARALFDLSSTLLERKF